MVCVAQLEFTKNPNVKITKTFLNKGVPRFVNPSLCLKNKDLESASKQDYMDRKMSKDYKYCRITRELKTPLWSNLNIEETEQIKTCESSDSSIYWSIPVGVLLSTLNQIQFLNRLKYFQCTDQMRKLKKTF